MIDEHRYLATQIAIEYFLKLGSKKPHADIVIWDKNISEKTQDKQKLLLSASRKKFSRLSLIEAQRI